MQLPGLTDTDTWTLLNRLGVRGSEPAITGFFTPLGNHPLLVGIVAGLVSDYRTAPGDFDRWLGDPVAGGALSVPGLNLTQRRTHILAAALGGLEPGPRRLLGWISVLVGAVTWDTLEAINPFQPEAPVSVELDFDPRGYPLNLPEALGHFTAWRSSEHVLRAKAQLDAALKDLEDRGLVWWDRSSNSYDLHPIIRAYAYDELESTDRIRANERVRDHFQALPPEDPARASSVEDLTQTITIFRALIGAGHDYQASSLWSDFGDVLLVNLGAHATVIELLSPLATRGTLRVRSNLALAYYELGRFDEAISQDTELLANALVANDDNNIAVFLSRLVFYFLEAGAYLTASRCSDLLDVVHAAAGHETDGDQYLNHAVLAARQGRVKQARSLLAQAGKLGPPAGFWWFTDDVEYWGLYLALVADRSLTHARLAETDIPARSWKFRRGLAGLRYELLVRQREFDRALAAAHEYEHLGRNAGLEVGPAATAFVLSKLGRAREAAAAVEESFASFPRIHPAQRPHRDLARALWELGRQPEAASQARDAYRQAWHDGPPNSDHWALREAREILQAMGGPIPDLPVLDPVTVKAPLEDEVRAFITRLEAERSRTQRGRIR